MWGILDLQTGEIREETYETRKQAICEFSDYWRNIAFSDWFDNFEFPEGLSEEQKDEMVWNDLKSIEDETFLLDYFEFEPVELAE